MNRGLAYKDCEEYIEEPIVELTLKDISEGKGVEVSSHLIKIIEVKIIDQTRT